jgi:flagellar hook-associated protein 1 FlgK
MSMSTAMLSALSGLRAAQSGLDIVANNVSNAGTPGYTRKAQENKANVVGVDAIGVQRGEVTRILDRLIQRQMWTEGAGGTYTATKSEYHSRLDALFGTPGSTTSLDGIFNGFTNALQKLAASPDSSTARTEVLSAAQVLAQHLNGMSADVQSMRSQTELSIASKVQEVNDALQNIQRIGAHIQSNAGLGSAPPALLDERDGYITKLASLMDIKVVPGDGDQISIFTSSGALLFDGEPAVLSFDSRGELGTQSLYSTDPSQRTVGTITLTSPSGSQTDMIASKLIRSGELAALIELRDDILVEAQTQLDTIAAGMSLALSNRTVAGTAASAGAQTGFTVDLDGSQNGNPLTISTVSGGIARQTVFVEVAAGTPLPLPSSANGGAAGVTVVGYTGGLAGAAAAVTAALGPGFTVSTSGTSLTVLDDGAAGTTDVTAMSASITNTALSGEGTPLPLFVDAGRGTLYTGTFDGGSQRIGFAARIGLNKAVLADPASLVRYDAATLPADSKRPTFLLEALTKTQTAMPPDSGIGASRNPFTTTVGGFARAVVETQGRNAETAANIDAGQQIVVDALNDKFQDTSGVNVDTEMANLLELQNAYAANARVMSTIRDMLNALMAM